MLPKIDPDGMDGDQPGEDALRRERKEGAGQAAYSDGPGYDAIYCHM